MNENGLPVLNPFTSRSFPVFLERDPVERTVYGKFFLTRTVYIQCKCTCMYVFINTVLLCTCMYMYMYMYIRAMSDVWDCTCTSASVSDVCPYACVDVHHKLQTVFGMRTCNIVLLSRQLHSHCTCTCTCTSYYTMCMILYDMCMYSSHVCLGDMPGKQQTLTVQCAIILLYLYHSLLVYTFICGGSQGYDT